MGHDWSLAVSEAAKAEKRADLVQDLTNIAAVLVIADPRRWREEIKSLTAWADELADDRTKSGR